MDPILPVARNLPSFTIPRMAEVVHRRRRHYHHRLHPCILIRHLAVVVVVAVVVAVEADHFPLLVACRINDIDLLRI